MNEAVAGLVDPRARRTAALRRAPLFSGLDDSTLGAVEASFEAIPIPGGATLFEAGDPGDALYVVSFGCLAVFDPPGPEGNARVIAEIPVGDIVGEMSLIGHRRRSHTIAAIRDSEVLRLTRSEFERVCADHPEALMGLLAKVVERYGSPPRPDMRPPRTIALLPHGLDTPCAPFAADLAAALKRLHAQGGVEVIGPESMGQPPENFYRAEAESAFVIYRAEPGLTPWTRLCLRQADALLILAMSDRPPSGPQLIDAIRAEEMFRGGPFRSRRELVLVHESGRRAKAGSTAQWLNGQDYGMHHHVRLGRDNDFNRLARLLMNRAVGVVMAGGGARSFAHIGAVRALREVGVPIDLVGGTSMGAIVAASVATGWTIEEMQERFRHAFADRNPLNDYTVPFVSLFSGKRVTRLLRAAFGEVDIEDLPKPFFCVSANLTRQNADVHRRGKLWHWLRASVSIPGVLPPVLASGSVHVDGGVIDNFPVTAMRNIGRGPVVGIDIDTGGELMAGNDVVESWSAWEFLRRLVWSRGETLPIPSIVRLLLRSALVGSTSRALTDRTQVDMLVLPAMKDIDLLDWTRFDQVVEAGYVEAMKVLEATRGEPVAKRLYLV